MIYRFGDCELDLLRYELRRGGRPRHLEPQVFEVLSYLVRNRDRVVTKNELLDQVWGSRFVTESALTSRLKAARRAVGDSGREQRVIRTSTVAATGSWHRSRRAARARPAWPPCPPRSAARPSFNDSPPCSSWPPPAGARWSS